MKGLKKWVRSAQHMDPRLVVLSRGPGLYSTKQLVKEAENEGWAVRVVDPMKLTVLIDDGGRQNLPQRLAARVRGRHPANRALDNPQGSQHRQAVREDRCDSD